MRARGDCNLRAAAIWQRANQASAARTRLHNPKPNPPLSARPRFCQMMWRLNFLVFFCCVVLQVRRGPRAPAGWAPFRQRTPAAPGLGILSATSDKLPGPLLPQHLGLRMLPPTPRICLPPPSTRTSTCCTTSAPCTRSSPSWCTARWPSRRTSTRATPGSGPSEWQAAPAARPQPPRPPVHMCVPLACSKGMARKRATPAGTHARAAACPHVACARLAPHLRILGCFATVFVFWDIKAVFYALWSPFDFIMGYTDPRKPSGDRMHGERGCSACSRGDSDLRVVVEGTRTCCADRVGETSSHQPS